MSSPCLLEIISTIPLDPLDYSLPEMNALRKLVKHHQKSSTSSPAQRQLMSFLFQEMPRTWPHSVRSDKGIPLWGGWV